MEKLQDKCKVQDNNSAFNHNFGDYIFFKSMNFTSSFLEQAAESRNKVLISVLEKQQLNIISKR